MRFTLLVSIPLLLAAQDETRNPLTSPADAAAGAKTFRSHCSECHGLKGEGGRGPSLATGVFYHGSTDADLLRNISDGIPGTEMPGLFYSPDRVWQVVTYLRSLNARESVAGDRQNGAKLFRSKNCAQCHRIQGQGGRLGPDLSQIGRNRAVAHIRAAIVDPDADVRQRYWFVSATDKQGRTNNGFLMNEDTYTIQFMDMGERLHSLNKADLREFRVEKTSKMPSYKGALTESELNDLTAYLTSLRPTGGAR
ncbi:MAG: c-type cytochrome [Acidobacteria bacterium]|nr:c-type cytochrome [Acidobacteriota bacterium]